jgi:hypothetical protein
LLVIVVVVIEDGTKADNILNGFKMGGDATYNGFFLLDDSLDDDTGVACFVDCFVVCRGLVTPCDVDRSDSWDSDDDAALTTKSSIVSMMILVVVIAAAEAAATTTPSTPTTSREGFY